MVERWWSACDRGDSVKWRPCGLVVECRLYGPAARPNRSERALRSTIPPRMWQDECLQIPPSYLCAFVFRCDLLARTSWSWSATIVYKRHTLCYIISIRTRANKHVVAALAATTKEYRVVAGKRVSSYTTSKSFK